MKLKVGDKVKIVSNSNGSGIVRGAMGKIGTVSSIGAIGNMVQIEFDKEVWGDLTIIGFYENEIERVFTKGEQLLLFEM